MEKLRAGDVIHPRMHTHLPFLGTFPNCFNYLSGQHIHVSIFLNIRAPLLSVTCIISSALAFSPPFLLHFAAIDYGANMGKVHSFELGGGGAMNPKMTQASQPK